jgi:hypothetical protein
LYSPLTIGKNGYFLFFLYRYLILLLYCHRRSSYQYGRFGSRWPVNPATCWYLSHSMSTISIMFFVFSEWRWKIDTGGIVDLHCLHFLFIITWSSYLFLVKHRFVYPAVFISPLLFLLEFFGYFQTFVTTLSSFILIMSYKK